MIAMKFAQRMGVSTLLLTGKGEPLLYLDDLKNYLMDGHNMFPFIELQTNGILFDKNEKNHITDDLLFNWYQLGLTTVSLSIAHWDAEENARILRPDNPYYIWGVVRRLHNIGFSVRINCTLLRGYIDTPNEVARLRDVCREYDVEQLTVREVSRTDYPGDMDTYGAAVDMEVNGLCDRTLMWAKSKSRVVELLELPHGGKVLDWEGQNVCLANCLTESKDPDDIRQLIFFPDGRLRYSWQHEGAVIL